MSHDCSKQLLMFEPLGEREVVAQFNGGTITSDAGGLLLREVDRRFGVFERLSKCFADYRDPRYTDFTVKELLAQRIFALAQGWEDLNDHEELRKDPLFAVLVGRKDPTGQDRLHSENEAYALAGKSTLNRLELTPERAVTRYKKIAYHGEAIEEFFLDLFILCHEKAPEEIIVDLDATNDPLHGQQEGAFFNGYYDEYCYLPLYVFCGDFLLCAKLRSSEVEASEGSLEVMKRIEAFVHKHWPETRMTFRGDAGFCRDELMDWCETHPCGKLDYVFGLAKNSRLLKEIAGEIALAESEFAPHQERLKAKREEWKALGKTQKEIQEELEKLGNPSRRYSEFHYQTEKSWKRERRVIAKAEHLQEGPNPRFVVTSIRPEKANARTLYESLYCGRGDMENRIKENQLFLFADRTSAHTMRANQLRLWFSSVAYTLVMLLRKFGLKGTEHARAQCDTIRNKLLKIGAQVIVSVRRVLLRLSSGYPLKDLFLTVLKNLRNVPACLRC